MPLTYSDSILPYSLGRPQNMEEWNGFTRTKEGAATLGFGVPVMPGTTPHTCVELDATTGRNVLGITAANQVLPHLGDSYNQYDNVGIYESVVVGVNLGANVTEGAQARWNTVAKNWTGAAQSATVVTIPGAQFEVAANSGTVGLIRYRRPVPSLSVSG